MKQVEIPELMFVSRDLANVRSYPKLRHECSIAVHHALNVGDPRRAGWAYLALADAQRRTGDRAGCEVSLGLGMEAWKLLADKRGLAWAYWARGNLDRHLSKYAAADRSLTIARDFARSSCDAQCFAYSLAGLAENNRIRGQFGIAYREHRELLTLFESHGDVRGVVWALEGIAQIHRMQKDYARAAKVFCEAVELASMAHDLRGLGYALKGLGESTVLQGDANGIVYVSQAIKLFGMIGFAVGELFSKKTMGDLLLRLEEPELAIELYREAIAGFESARYERGAAFAKLGLAWAFHRLRRVFDAALLVVAAQTFFEKEKIMVGQQRCRALIDALELGRPDSSPLWFAREVQRNGTGGPCPRSGSA